MKELSSFTLMVIFISVFRLTFQYNTISHFKISTTDVSSETSLKDLILRKQKQITDLKATNTEFLLEQELNGTYSNSGDSFIADYIQSSQGTIEAIFYKDSFSQSNLPIDRFAMLMFDPTYHDGRAMQMELSLNNMSSQNKWEGQNADVTVRKIWKQRTTDEYNISDISYSIEIKNIESEDIENVEIVINFIGDKFNINASLSYKKNTLSTLGYCLYVSAVVIIQILSLFIILKKIETNNPNLANKISLATIAICNIEDFYLTMTHIEYIMTSSSNAYLLFILPTLSYIILFVIFDMKILFLVWRSHYMRELDNPQQLRKKLTAFYIKFYLGLFIYLTLSYFFTYEVWMIVLQNLVLIPQIVHNVRLGNNPGFNLYYIIGYILARFLIPVYERSCPDNHFLLTPIPPLIISLLILYTLQIIILFLQYKLGPRFFVPKIFLPNYYDYKYKLKAHENNESLECSICLQSFFTEQTDINYSMIDSPMIKDKTVMKTPCNHFFHVDCLTSWIDVKLQCPSCRGQLPPP